MNVTSSRAWRGVISEYRDRLPVTEATPVVSLREGGTPLLPAPVLSARTGVICARCSIVEAEYFPVKGICCGIRAKPRVGVDVGNRRSLKLRARDYNRGKIREYQPHALAIEKEEQLVLFDRAA